MPGLRPLTVRTFLTASTVIPATVLLVSCGSRVGPQVEPELDPGDGVERLGVEVVDERPFDPSAFTQGLEMDEDGSLIVGTGLEGQSRIFRMSDTGDITDSQDLDPDLFGEGITRHGDSVWQLTWKAGVAIERDAHTLEEKNRVLYDGEGWGICAFDDTLIQSDGSDSLRFRDPGSFDVTDTRQVRAGGTPVSDINELECVQGPDGGREVWANIWYSDEIIRIDPENGDVTAVADASALREALPEEAAADADVLNGIAHIPGTDRYLLTGKLWPTVFEVRFT